MELVPKGYGVDLSRTGHGWRAVLTKAIAPLADPRICPPAEVAEGSGATENEAIKAAVATLSA